MKPITEPSFVPAAYVLPLDGDRHKARMYYARHYGFAGGRPDPTGDCAICGGPAGAVDHVVPLVHIAHAFFLSHLKTEVYRGTHFWTFVRGGGGWWETLPPGRTLPMLLEPVRGGYLNRRYEWSGYVGSFPLQPLCRSCNSRKGARAPEKCPL